MKALSFSAYCLCLALSAPCLAQVDIYQSDAYSVEEMCAREAEQAKATDYSSAYENCIEKNSNKPMYQSAANRADTRLAGESDSLSDTVESKP
ncbi:hypothetical protein [Marinimicrobium locisalis]|uniref:hypothetical protein n=1 Tax=Marinimicrobium locisalis TaxID=546022 RepID=UPI00322145E3